MPLSLVLTILVPLLVIVLIWVFARNAIAMKRDIDQRFDRLRNRLETEATEAIEPLLRDRAGENDST